MVDKLQRLAEAAAAAQTVQKTYSALTQQQPAKHTQACSRPGKCVATVCTLHKNTLHIQVSSSIQVTHEAAAPLAD